MLGKKDAGTNTGWLQTIPKTTVNTIRCSILRWPNPITKVIENNNHHAVTQRTCGNQQNDDGGKTFWWPRLTRDIQQKCDECIPCKMASKNIKPQLPMTEINYLPPVEKTNREIQLDFIGPIRFKHWRFYILLSIDRYSRWPAACICEAPTGKTANNFLEQYTTLNGLPQTIKTAKGTAFTGKEFRETCKYLNIKLNMEHQIYTHQLDWWKEVSEH